MKMINTVLMLMVMISGASYAASLSVTANKTLTAQNLSSLHYQNLAYSCYKHCWTDRWGRHCNTVCR